MKNERITLGEIRTVGIGGGDYAIEVYDTNGNIVKEFIGSNGTQRPADDLFDEFQEWQDTLQE